MPDKGSSRPAPTVALVWRAGGERSRGDALARHRALHRPAPGTAGLVTAHPPALAGSSRQAGSLARPPVGVNPPSAVPPSADCGSPPAFHHPAITRDAAQNAGAMVACVVVRVVARPPS